MVEGEKRKMLKYDKRGCWKFCQRCGATYLQLRGFRTKICEGCYYKAKAMGDMKRMKLNSLKLVKFK